MDYDILQSIATSCNNIEVKCIIATDGSQLNAFSLWELAMNSDWSQRIALHFVFLYRQLVNLRSLAIDRNGLQWIATGCFELNDYDGLRSIAMDRNQSLQTFKAKKVTNQPKKSKLKESLEKKEIKWSFIFWEENFWGKKNLV